MNILDASLDKHNNQKKAIWKFIIETSSKTRFLELLEKLEKVPNVLKVIDNTKY
jgi:nitrate reductase NapAB chaperone NapD